MSGLVVGVRPEAAVAYVLPAQQGQAPVGASGGTLDPLAVAELIGAAEAGLVKGAMARAEQRREA